MSERAEKNTSALDESHTRQRRARVESANQPDHGFPIQNLPWCVVEGASGLRRGVRIGDDFFDLGLAAEAGLLDETGNLPGTRAAFLGASVASALGGVLGTSPTIIHNETCAGIAEGGRTGLTALVVAAFFGLSIFFVPVFAAVPLTATAPALIVVGAFMMCARTDSTTLLVLAVRECP